MMTKPLDAGRIERHMQRLRMEVSGGRAQSAPEVGVLAKDKQEENYDDDDDERGRKMRGRRRGGKET